MLKLRLLKFKPVLQLTLWFSLLAVLFCISTPASAEGAQKIGTVADLIRQSFGNVASLLVATSYVCGIAFSMMGLFKLKSHKDSPQQVPLSQPIVLLVIGSCLVFLPSVIKTAGATIWAGEEESTGVSGEWNIKGTTTTPPPTSP